MSADQDGAQEHSGNSLYAAVARTATRSIALYFSRPVRLFRPSKVSGWQTLKGLATHHGESLTPRYISWLIRKQGFAVIPKHFIPPMMVNLALGSVLWTTYSTAGGYLENHFTSPIAVAALAGGAAGGMQALVAAPAENVRFALEGGSPATGWSLAWKEVFRGTEYQPLLSKQAQINEARQVRDWMREVGEMAGRGWDGWAWGFAKDVCGFALFFSIFEITRRLAPKAKASSQALIEEVHLERSRKASAQRHVPRIVHALTLVSGGAVAGLVYELACRPWDKARKAVDVDRLTMRCTKRSIPSVLLQKLREEGLSSFFASPSHATHESTPSVAHRRIQSILRTMARVGPWGIGFLVWEAFGPGIS